MAKTPTSQTRPTTPDPAQAVARLQSWIEVFRAGTHRDSEGRECTFSAADLDQMVANESLGAAPAVLGHPDHDDPAYAWTNGFKREGDTLLCRFTDINPVFALGVANGAYRNRSVCVIRDPQHGWRVRHVGWLGAAPPAINGLRRAFAADALASEIHEFGALSRVGSAIVAVASIAQSMRDQLIEASGIDAADKTIPQWRIDSLRELGEGIDDDSDLGAAASMYRARPAPTIPTNEDTMANTPNTGATNTGATNAGTPTAPAADRAEIDRAVAEALAVQQREFSAQLSSASERTNKALAELRDQRIGTQIAAWQREGRLLPTEARGLASFMAALEDGEPREFAFSAADGKEAKQTPAAWFAAFMAARPPVLKLGGSQFAGSEPAPTADDADALAGKARAYMAEQERAGITVTYAEAVMRVSSAK